MTSQISDTGIETWKKAKTIYIPNTPTSYLRYSDSKNVKWSGTEPCKSFDLASLPPTFSLRKPTTQQDEIKLYKVVWYVTKCSKMPVYSKAEDNDDRQMILINDVYKVSGDNQHHSKNQEYDFSIYK